MTATRQQRRAVDKQINFICISNSTQLVKNRRIVNTHACIALAFMLGIRFGMAHPNQAGEYMASWLDEFANDPQTAATNHERAMQRATRPIMDEEEEQQP